MLRLLSTILLAGSSGLAAFSYLAPGIDLVSILDHGPESLLLAAIAFLTGALLARLCTADAGTGRLLMPITAGAVGAVIGVFFQDLPFASLPVVQQIPEPDITVLDSLPAGEFILRASIGYTFAASLALIISWLYGLVVRPGPRQAPHRQSIRINPEDLTAARWVTGHDDLRNVLDRCVTTQEKMPHIHKKLHLYWGYPEFFEYVDSLLTMERGREGRQGFDDRITEELLMVRQVFIDNLEQVMAPDLKQQDRERIRKLIQHYL